MIPFRTKPVSEEARLKARERSHDLLMPLYAMGACHRVVEQLAAIQGTPTPEVRKIGLVLFAGDHGVANRGVARYPQSITAAMVEVFLKGGGCCNALVRGVGGKMLVVNAGVITPITVLPEAEEVVGFVNAPIAPGTRDMSEEPAMSAKELEAALNLGYRATARFLEEHALDLLCLGEMGIGNTTAASALTAWLLKVPPQEVTGRGADLPQEQLPQKVNVIAQALKRHTPRIATPFDALAALGGFELAGLVGACFAAGEKGVGIVVDGFIATASVALAVALAPELKPYLFFGHRGAEPGHRLLLESLKAEPLLHLGMRLGEGTGAILAADLIRLFTRFHREMYTFSSLGLKR